MIRVAEHRRGAVLILVVGLIAILATIATAFLARSRGTAAVGEDAIRLAQTRIMLNAGMTYIREASRLGYALVEGGGDPAAGDLYLDDAREGWGWIDTRTIVPGSGTRIGPNAFDGTPLWTSGRWPAPGTHLRAPMYRMARPPFATTQDYVRNPIPADVTKPTFGIPFFANPDPIPLLPEGSYFDENNPWTDGNTESSEPPAEPLVDTVSNKPKQARKVWAMGDRTPVSGTADLAWFRVYRERIQVDLSGALVSAEPTSQAIPDNAGICTFIITVGAGGSRGYADWAEVQADNAELTFSNSRELFEEIVRHEQRQWFRVGWSAAVGGGEDLIVASKMNEMTGRGPRLSQFEQMPINATRYRQDEIVAPSHPRNYGGTISYIQRLDEPPTNW